MVRERLHDILYSLEKLIDPPSDEPFDWLDHTDYSTVYVYMEVQNTGEEDLEFHLLSALPDVGRRDDHMTWLEFEITNDEVQLWETTFQSECRYCKDGEYSMTPVADWAIQNGICPGQWFIVRLKPNYTETYDSWSGGYECDFECSARVMDLEKVSPREHMDRWMEFLTGQNLEDGLPRLGEALLGDTDAVALAWMCAPDGPEE